MDGASGSGGGVETVSRVVDDEEKMASGVAEKAASGKLKVVRVKRKREQAPIENLCELYFLFFWLLVFLEFNWGRNR